MTEFTVLRPKTYSCLKDENEEKKKDTKKCVIKPKFNFEDYKYFLEVTQFENKLNQWEKRTSL